DASAADGAKFWHARLPPARDLAALRAALPLDLTRVSPDEREWLFVDLSVLVEAALAGKYVDPTTGVAASLAPPAAEVRRGRPRARSAAVAQAAAAARSQSVEPLVEFIGYLLHDAAAAA